MSNVLCPIVARYSLFYILALSDSSRLARSKHPRQAVHELVLNAQERFQARHHADATLKLRAVNRNVSTASACSSKTSSTATSSQSSASLTLSTSSSSSPSSSYSSTLVSPCQAISAISTEAPISASPLRQCPSAAAGASCDRCMSSLPSIDGKSAVVSTCASATFALSTIAPHHHAAISLSAAPTLDTSEEHNLLLVDPSPAVLAHSCTAPPSTSDPSAPYSFSSTSLSSSLNPPCSAVHPSRSSSRSSSRPTSLSRAGRRPKTKLIHHSQPAPPSAYSRTFSIATLLSISLTVIFLSLMQSRRKHLRRRSQHTQQKKPLSRRRNLIDPSNSSAPSSPPSPQRSIAYKDSESDDPLSSHFHDEFLSTTAHSAPSPPSSLKRYSVTMPGTTGHRRDPRLLKQTREDYVSAWLSQQEGCTDSALKPMEEEPRDDSNSMEEITHLQHNLVDSSQQSSQQPVPTRGRNMPSAHHQLYPPPPPHLACPSSVVRGRESEHRRSISLVNPNHAPAPWPQPPQNHLRSEQIHQRHHSTERSRHASLQHHGYQPAHPATPHHPANVQQHYRTGSMQEPVESFERWTATRTANELAWERHNYYQRLQREEEQLAKKMRREELQRQYRQPNQVHAVRQVHRQDSSVARTGSLNRLACPSQLSAETSRILGLCRSNTLSAAVKRISLSTKKDLSSHPATPTHSTVNNEDIIMTVTAEADDENTLGMAVPAGNSNHHHHNSTSSPSSSSHAPRKSFKDHLAPPLRSLARRCSARFSSGGSNGSRPNSVVGSSSGGGARDSAADRALRRRSTGSAPASTISDHMYDFKPLQAGPETMEIQKQREEREALINSVLSEKVPVHRTVSLFRSRTLHRHHHPQRTPPGSTITMMGEGEQPVTKDAAESMLPTRSKRRSLRFANGRGLDFSTLNDLRGEKIDGHNRTISDANGVPRELRTADQTYPLVSSASTSTSLSSLLETMSDMDEHESMRKEILAILALGRKGTRRATSNSRSASGNGHSQHGDSSATMTTTTTTATVSRPVASTSTTSHRLSPLAVEAQEHIPVQREDEDESEDEDEVLNMMATGSKAQMMDPCEHITFMLVPKSRYEFQPLIV